MLKLKIKNTNTINADGNRIYLEDATGVYDAVTNPTGYGGANAERSSIALGVIVVNKTSKGDVLISLEPYNPISAATFNVIALIDGWYQFNLAAFPLFDPLAELPPLGSYVYVERLGKLVKIVDEEGTNFQDAKLLDILGTSYVKDSTDCLFVANNSKTKQILNKLVSDLIYKGALFGDKLLTRYKDNYNIVRAILQGSIYEFCRGNKYIAQRNIEFLNTNNYVPEQL